MLLFEVLIGIPVKMEFMETLQQRVSDGWRVAYVNFVQITLFIASH